MKNNIWTSATLKKNIDSNWTYEDGFLSGGGKELSVAYLKDLGYDQKEAVAITNKLAKRGRTLGVV